MPVARVNDLDITTAVAFLLLTLTNPAIHQKSTKLEFEELKVCNVLHDVKTIDDIDVAFVVLFKWHFFPKTIWVSSFCR